MSRIKRILLAFILVSAVSIVSPASLPNTQTVQAHGSHHSSHHSSQSTKKTKMVYITDDCYHTHKCSSGTSYSRCSLKKAKSYGLRKCKTCY